MWQTIWKPVLLLLALAVFFNFFYALIARQGTSEAPISYSQFKEELVKDNITKITLRGSNVRGDFKNPVKVTPPATGGVPINATSFTTIIPSIQDPGLMQELDAHHVEVTAVSPESPPLMNALLYMLPWLLILGIWWIAMRGARAQGPGGGIMGGFAKSGARLYGAEKVTITFDDVAGMEDAKQELREVVDYLKNPRKFEKIGGKIPKGILLIGPPGTGKTLMARAIAGEAGVTFFSISASQFIEMFVGVGASRVRDLFANAKRSAPSIVFIDELDAVGRSRGAGLGGGHDEREQTLNQLLSEMDGFDPHEEVVVLAATNRPDVLDSALMRPGRFDRHVVIERPDWRDREKILRVHARKIKLSDEVDLAVIAKGTPGMTGADLENLMNEAAILAARDNAPAVTNEYLERAKDKILMGGERKMYISDAEKRITAYHEAGHALVAKLLPGTDPVHKVTIIPRGQALGVTQQLPEDDRYHYSSSYLKNRLCVAMGGRVAERIVFDDLSTGAQNDLKVVTELAEKMVCQWGMSERIGPVIYGRGEEHPFLGMKLAQEKTFSDETAWLIDQEISVTVKEAEERAEGLILENRKKLDALAKALMEEETLEGRRIDEILAAV